MQPISFRMVKRYSGRGSEPVARSCEHCGRTAAPAVQIVSFVYLGRSIRCPKLLSRCAFCGLEWDDEKYEIENELFAQQAREVVLKSIARSPA